MALHVETKREYGPFRFAESHEQTSDKLVALLEAYDAVRMKQRGMLHRLNALVGQEPTTSRRWRTWGMFLREANRLEEAGAVCERALASA